LQSFRRQARVPIIRLISKCSDRIAVDISVTPNTVKLTNKYMKKYLKEYGKWLKPYLMAVKHWGKVRGIIDASQGLFNSYGITLLAIKSGQEQQMLPVYTMDLNGTLDDGSKKIGLHTSMEPHCTVGKGRAKRKKPEPLCCLSMLLFQFFKFFLQFDEMKHSQIITVTQQGFIPKFKHIGFQFFNGNDYFVIIDPIDPTNNVSKHVTSVTYSPILLEFHRAFLLCLQKYNSNYCFSSVLIQSYKNNRACDSKLGHLCCFVFFFFLKKKKTYQTMDPFHRR
ncbi:hypothetical protein RFI_12961, partial [Reticulomyxa filosa]